MLVERRDAVSSYMVVVQQLDGTTFWISTRKLRPALKEQYPHRITLENSTLGLVIVPIIYLRSMHQISFKEIARLVLEANKEIDSLHLYVRQLWVAVVRRIYHFEDSTGQQGKLGEVCCCG